MGSFGGSIVNGIISRENTTETNLSNQAIASDTNATNKEVAEQNLAFQRENLDYQKALQQQIFAREDSAYQRTVNDMRLAGVSPLAMAGTNGAGEAIATSPLHNEFQAQNPYAMLSPEFTIGNILEDFKSLEELKGMQQNNELAGIRNRIASETADDEISLKRIENKINEANLAIRRYEQASAQDKRAYDIFYGLNDKMSPEERKTAILSSLLGTDSNLPEDLSNSNSFTDPRRINGALNKLQENGKEYTNQYDLLFDYLALLGYNIPSQIRAQYMKLKSTHLGK